MKMILSTISILLGGYILICLLLYIFQKHLIYFPDKQLVFTPDIALLEYEDIYMQTRDGLKIHGWYIPADSAERVLIFCHGNAGNISHRIASIQIFHQLGLNILIFDYRGFGRSEGTPDEQGTYLDAEAAWHYLTESKGYRASQIVVFGRSLGTGIASWLAREKRPSSLILESSFTSMPDLAARLYPLFPARWLSRYSYPTRENLKHLSLPVLFIHSPGDEIIPYELGRENYAIAREPKTFLEISGSHNDGFLVSGEIYLAGIARFLKDSRL